MAWAEKIPSSGRWRGLYRDRAGRRLTDPDGPFSTKTAAKNSAAAKEFEARKRPGQIDPTAGRLTWGDWADQWWPRRGVEPGTLARDASRRFTHLEPRWKHERLEDIGREDVQAWVDTLYASGLAPATVARCYHLFSASMKAAVLANRIPTSPCTAIMLPKIAPPDERYLAWAEVEQITHFFAPADALLVWLLVGTGVRWGEGVGAHRHRLHLEPVDAARLDVHEVWDQRLREVKPYPKGRQKRSVPLPGWLVARLVDHLDGLGDSPSTCGSPHRRGSRCRSGLVVPGRSGGALDYDAFHDRWSRVVGWWVWEDPKSGRSWRAESTARQAVGGDVDLVRTWRPGLVSVGPVTIHDLRHTYASWLLQDGVSIEALSDLLGHASIQTTMRYAHLASTQWSRVRAALEARRPPVATLLPHIDQSPEKHDQQAAGMGSSAGVPVVGRVGLEPTT